MTYGAQMWFGTRNHEQWVPQCAPGADYIKVGWSTKSQLLNGGAWVRGSKAGHREYPMVWNPTKTRDSLRPITDFADGVYDDNDGTNLIYFLTPDAMDKNVAPQNWAFPGQEDAMPLVISKDPVLSATPVNTNGYPARSATYTLAGTETAAKVYIPVPPGYTAWVGAAGSTTGSAGMKVTPWNLTTSGAVTNLTLLAVTSTTRVNASFDSSTCTGIEISPKIGAGTLTLSGVTVQVLPTGQTPLTGIYISGQGHSGCLFEGAPAQTVYQVTPTSEAIGMTAKLTEVGSWI